MKKLIVKKCVVPITLCCALVLSACQTTSSTSTTISSNDAFGPININNTSYYETVVQNVSQDSCFNALILQTRYYINLKDFNSANNNILKMEQLATTPLEKTELDILKSSITFIQKQYEIAYDMLKNVNALILPNQSAIYYYSLYARVNEELLNKNHNNLYYNNAFNAYKSLIAMLSDSDANNIAQKALKLVERNTPSELSILLSKSTDFTDKGFYQYALIETSSNANVKAKLFESFKQDYQGHVLCNLDQNLKNTNEETISSNTISATNTTVIPALKENDKIAVLAPFTGRFEDIGNTVKLAVIASLQDKNLKLDVNFYDTNTQDINTIVNTLAQNGTKFIIGPVLKPNVDSLIQSSNKIPAIVFNTSNIKMPDNMLYFDLSPNFEGETVAKKIMQDNHHNLLIVQSNSSHQQRIFEGLSLALAGQNINVTTCNYSDIKTIDQDLQSCNFVEPDAVYINGTALEANLIKAKINSQKAVYLTDIAYAGVNNSGLENSMQGALLGDMPWLLTESSLKQGYLQNIGKTSIQNQRIFASCYDSLTVATHLDELSSQGNTINGLSGDIHLESNQIYNNPLWIKLGTPR